MTARRLLFVLALAAIASAPLWLGGYPLTLLNYVAIFALVTLGLVVMTGAGGITSFGQAAFVGIGAYATAWWTTVMAGSPFAGLLIGLAASGVTAAVLGAATLRLGGHFLPLSTIAWGIAIDYMFGNVEALGSHNGIAAIPAIAFGDVSLITAKAFYLMVWPLLGLAMLLCANLLDSREGRAIRALRGGNALVESLGIDPFATRLRAFVLAALLASLSGWLYAHFQRVVSPTAFDLEAGIEFLLMALIGGAGHVGGAVVGSAIVTFLKEGLQSFLPLFTANSTQLQAVVLGALFILILQKARWGLLPFVLRALPRREPPPVMDARPLRRRAGLKHGAPLLAIEGVSKRFGGLIAVNDVSLELRVGEILGLIGPNGAGKSTLFNLVTGLAKPSAGRILFLEQDMQGLSARRRARLGMARTFQHVRLRPGMTLLDNVALGAYGRARAGFLRCALRLDRAEERGVRAEAARQLARVGLGHKLHHRAGALPLGEQRLLEVARALAADPALVILDEPAAGLRRLEKQALAKLIRALRQEGVTVMLVEHDMDFVMTLVDRIVVMDFGVKIAEGPPSRVSRDARVREAYLGVEALDVEAA
ncbi:branched-chain amino acid transport system permease protein [Rhizobiales bacterium GAS113]|nr:branched-chain amino acid transport system permease protein [Rhizobiales bacterium GAS113]SED45315.1 branched-chain amino acid transport system permease protein [Rhizobiales bacterium GAS188]